MSLNLESVVFYLLLLDSLAAVIVSLFFSKWYKKNMTKGVVKHFPATKGWSIFYLLLVLWIGYLSYRLGVFG